MYSLFKPLLFAQDPEAIHHRVTALAAAVQACPLALAATAGVFRLPTHNALQQTFFGQTFHSPVGLAAGFDKDLKLVSFMRAMGFGFVEVGSVSAMPSAGNPRPRLFRLPEEGALINRMGLNNPGLPALASRLDALPRDWPVGISLVKTHDASLTGDAAIADFVAGYQAVRTHGAYTCLNISCPNTQDGKTFEAPQIFDALLTALAAVNQGESSPARPLLVKLSPDVDHGTLDELVALGTRHGIAGWVAGNTTRSRAGLQTAPEALARIGAGGLSGAPLQSAADALLAALYARLQAAGSDALLIGVGGIRDVDSAWRKITLGASLLQLYTGLIYEGPGLIRKIHMGLNNRLYTGGYTHLRDAVGSALR